MKPKHILPGILFFVISCGQQGDKKDQSSKERKTESSDKTSVAENGPANQIFGIKAAKVVFNYTGAPMYAGTETLYFDDYGHTAVLITERGSGFSRTHQTSIWKNGKSTLINHETKKVASSPFRVKDSEPPSIADIPDATKKSIGYEKLPDETIAQKTCEVWYNAQQNIKYWLWKKIDLKMENQGEYTKEAVSVEEISSIPPSVMEIPKDYSN